LWPKEQTEISVVGFLLFSFSK